MPRYKITIEYDGTGLVGWQRQPNGPSVQAAIENAACEIIGRIHPVPIQGAGRTDAGVHATGQVAHLDLPKKLTTEKLPLALNAYLPPNIRVIKAEIVADDFHARFDASRRAYEYRINNRRISSAITRGQMWNVHKPLDCGAMQRAANMLVGRHDFTSFRAAQCQATSPVRTIDMLKVEKIDEIITIYVEAQSFLHNQVRNITGTLAEVGRGRMTPEAVKQALDAKLRKVAGPCAPPQGLYLVRVDYKGVKNKSLK